MEQQLNKRPRLLIVEDDFDNQKFLTLFLRKYFLVDACESSVSFYELLEENKYDLFIMDISIKGEKNGLDLMRELKLNPETCATPIICYTAHVFQQDRLNAIDAGCDEYITKPSNIYDLLAAILFHLDKKNRSSICEQDSDIAAA